MKNKYKKIKLRYGENPSQKANLITNSSRSIFDYQISGKKISYNNLIDLDSGLKPYLLQPSGANLSEIRASIEQKVEMIDRATHMSGVRQTKTQVQSGIALQTEFENLNSALSEKADLLENAEEQIWSIWSAWQSKVFDGEVQYPDSFNLRDYASDLAYLQQAKASGVRSSTFQKAIDKQIVDAVVDDDEIIRTINDEIDSQAEIGVFETAQTQAEVAEEEDAE